mgnify:CR=1 FL=1
MKKALVTLTIGESFERMFNELCKVNWQQYCEKFNYELIVLTNPLDTTERAKKRSPSWQKLLILSQDWAKQYDRIVWVDADVIINSKFAYDIIENVPENKVGAVSAYSIPTREIFNLAIYRLYDSWDKNGVKYVRNLTPQEYYLNRSIPAQNIDDVIQAGVFVCSPKYHQEIFEYVYYNYEDTRGNEYNYENPVLSYELLKNDKVYWISNRFNFCIAEIMAAFYPDEMLDYKKQPIFIKRVINKLKRLLNIPIENNQQTAILKNIYELSIFMHFAGSANLMPLMKDIIKD